MHVILSPIKEESATKQVAQAVAIADYVGTKSNHLSFKQGDTINLREQKELWWSGEIKGRVKSCPFFFGQTKEKCIVKIILIL